MQNTVLNTATLTFEYGSAKGSKIGYASSNVASTFFYEAVSVNKISLGDSYYLNENITYIITVKNNSNSEVTGLKIKDNLGEYNPNKYKSDLNFIPLEYIGPSYIYLNGIFTGEISPKIESGKLIFDIGSLSSGSVLNIMYKVSVNDKALLKIGSKIKNILQVFSDNTVDPVESSNSIKVAEKASVKIIKHMCPGTIVRGESVSYFITLYNYGNKEAVNVILNDVFSPIPKITNVTIDDILIPFSDYSYNEGVFVLPSYGSEFSLKIPPASFSQNSTTGVVSITPGTKNIILSGIV
ncbi:MAG: hypothetical protein Q4B84_00770 [Clostridia bacterium]|nr:hypothetical protein [Clostridia bacterium]